MSMMGGFGGNGQWARARNPEGARSVAAEIQSDAQREGERIERARQRRRQVFAWARSRLLRR